MAKKSLFQTQYNRDEFPVKGEVNNDPSETVPGEAYTVQELIEKSRLGIIPVHPRTEQFTEDADFDSVNPLLAPDVDLTDIDAALESSKKTISQYKAEIEEKRKKSTQEIQEKEKKADEKQKDEKGSEADEKDDKK